MNTRTANPSVPIRVPQKTLPGYLMLLAEILVIVCVTPWLSRNVPPVLIVGLPALLLCGYFWNRLPCSNAFPGTLMAVVSYVILTLAYKYLGISTAELGYYFAEYKFLFVMLVMACMPPSLSRKQRFWLCVLAAGGLVVNMVDNVRLWKMLGARYVLYFQRDGGTSNVADTAFTTAVMFGMGGFFLLALHARQRWLKAVAWVFVSFFVYFSIFVAQRGITFFLGMALLALLALPASAFRLDNPKKLALWSFSILALLGLFVGGGAEVLLSGLGGLLENSPRIHARITRVAMLLQTNDLGETGGSLSARVELIRTSIDTFLQSPVTFLFGVGNHRASFAFDAAVGNHSLFFDTLARYGLVGGFFFLWLLRRIAKTMSDVSELPLHHPMHVGLRIFFFVFVARSFFGNPLHGSVATQLFATVPLLVSFLASDGETTVHSRTSGKQAEVAPNTRRETC